MADRAVIYIDGNNWYHSISDLGVKNLGRLDYGKISTKLVRARQWIATRYYIGRLPQTGDKTLYADQRRFLDSLRATDERITTHLGRLERRPVQDPAADELRRYLANLQTRIDVQVYHDLMRIARDHQETTTFVEKAVDVMLAVDMVVGTRRVRRGLPALCGRRLHARGRSRASTREKSLLRISGEWGSACGRG